MPVRGAGAPNAGDSGFDVLVAGGGPAGLLVASLLPRQLRVGVVEKGTIGQTSKYWITSARRLAAHNLEDCVDASYPAAIFGTFLGKPLTILGDFVLVADSQLLDRLAQRAERSGVRFFERCPITAIRWEADHLNVTTATEQLTTRILVDATGGGSAIAATFRLHHLDGFYTVYGQRLDSVNVHSRSLIAGLVPDLGYPPIIFEAMAASDSTVLCSAFVIATQVQRADKLRVALERFIARNDYFSTSPETRLIDEKFGAIPIGRLAGRSLPGVVGFGEAGMMQSPLLGGAFNEVLAYAQPFAASLAASLANSDPGRPIAVPRPARKVANDWFQGVVARKLMSGSVLELERLVALLRSVGPDVAYRLLGSELTIRELLWLAVTASAPRRMPSKIN